MLASRRLRIRRITRPEYNYPQPVPVDLVAADFADRVALRAAADLAYPDAVGLLGVAVSVVIGHLHTRHDIALTTRIGWVRCRRLLDRVMEIRPDTVSPSDSAAVRRAARVCAVLALYPGEAGPAAYAAGLSPREYAGLLTDLGETETLVRVSVLAGLLQQ